MTKNTNWKTIFPAISVPLLDDYSINEPELRAYVEWLVEFEGIGGLVTNGHTGEVGSLSREERKRVTEIVVDQVGDRVLVVSGVNSENTYEAIEHANDAKEVGADGIMLMPPHSWLRFGMKHDNAIKFYKDVADATGMNIIVHLYPAYTKANLPVEVLLQMCQEIPQIKAIKQGTRVPSIYENDVRVLHAEHPDVALLTCFDEAIATSIIPRMDGAVLGFAGVIPELITGVFKAYRDMDFEKFMEYYDRIEPISQGIYGAGQPSGEAHARLKEALAQRGVFTSALMKLPIVPLEEDEKEGIRVGLEGTGLDKVNLKIEN